MTKNQKLVCEGNPDYPTRIEMPSMFAPSRMSAPLHDPVSSAVPFTDERTGQRVDALADAALNFSRAATEGVIVEVGENEGWVVDDLVVPQHYLAINLDPKPLRFERKVNGVFQPVTMDPGALWINPSGRPFSHRVATTNRFGLIVLEPEVLQRLAGVEVPTLQLTYHAQSPQLEHLTRALLAEVGQQTPNGPAFTQTMIAMIAAYLGQNFAAIPAAPVTGPERLNRQQLRDVKGYIEAHLGARLGVEDMAAVAGVSPFHFARAFKATTGQTPHRYLMQRRLERARDLLLQAGYRMSEIAYDLGFSDQSHFSRQFKRHFGLSPRQYVREAAR